MAGFITLMEEQSKEKITEFSPSEDLDDVTDTEDSGKGSFAMEDHVGTPLLPQSHQLLPTVIVTSEKVSSSSGSYEEALLNLFGETHHSQRDTIKQWTRCANGGN